MRTKPKNKTATALGQVLSIYGDCAEQILNKAFHDYYHDLFAAVSSKVKEEVATKGLNPVLCTVDIATASYTPVVLWCLIPGLATYRKLSARESITKVGEWVGLSLPYFDEDDALTTLIQQGREQLRDVLSGGVPSSLTYNTIRSMVEHSPCLSLLFPTLTFKPRRLTTPPDPFPILPAVISVLTMHRTMFKEETQA